MMAPCSPLHVSPITLGLPCVSLSSTFLHMGKLSHEFLTRHFCIPIMWGKSKQAAEQGLCSLSSVHKVRETLWF